MLLSNRIQDLQKTEELILVSTFETEIHETVAKQNFGVQWAHERIYSLNWKYCHYYWFDGLLFV